MNTDASILVYKFRPERTGFNMYAEYTHPQLTFLALLPCPVLSFWLRFGGSTLYIVQCTMYLVSMKKCPGFVTI